MLKLKKRKIDTSKLSIKKLSDIVSFSLNQKNDKKELLSSTDQMGLENLRTHQDNRKLIIKKFFFSWTGFWKISYKNQTSFFECMCV